MAENLQLLKRRIRTAKNIAQISRAMEMTAASKIKRAQTAVSNYKPYASRVTELTQRLLRKTETNFSHPFLEHDTGKKLLIVLAPDKGLCGSLLTNLYRKLLEVDTENYLLVTVGKRIELVAPRLKADLTASFLFGTSLPEYDKVFELTQLIKALYAEKKISGVDIVFTEFQSLFQQTPIKRQLLPIQTIREEDEMDEEEQEYTVEPEPALILQDLLPLYAEVLLFDAIIQAFTSEQAARMIAMQNAKNNATDIADYLTLSYNKQRQERITNEILDLANNQ